MIQKKFTNEKLEFLFSQQRAENYSMYDTYFKEKCDLGSQEIFKEHYNNFKPTLDQIKQLKSSSEGADLSKYDIYFQKKCDLGSQEIFKEHYNNFKQTLDQIKQFDPSALKSSGANLAEIKYNTAPQFAVSDFNNLSTIPFNNNARLQFVQDLLPDYLNDCRPIRSYRCVLEFLDHPSGVLKNLSELSEFIGDTQNHMLITSIFQKTRIYGYYILKHPDIDSVIDITVDCLNKLPTHYLDLFNFICTRYESFALATYEPHLVASLGTVLFLKVFLPLHRAGAFTLFMNKVIQIIKSKR